MKYIFIVLIAISLSMDAFSLALSIGTLSIPKKKYLIISTVVGIFHFFMPLLGTMVGNLFINSMHINGHLLSATIFFYIAILMFKDYINDEEEIIKISFIGIIIFAIGVSLDSFGVGVAIGSGLSNMYFAFLTFSVLSFSFTYLGFKLGSSLNKLIGQYSILIGASIMTLISIINFCKFLF